MASNPPPPPPPPPMSGDREKPDDKSGTRRESPGWSRYILWIIIGTLLTVMLFNYFTGGDSREQVTYSNFLERVADGDVQEAKYDNNDGGIVFTTELGEFETTGPTPLPDADHDLIGENTKLEFDTPKPNFFTSIFPILLPVLLLIGFFFWMQRRAQGQLGNIMSVGRSKAKTYSTERPGTTFDDVAGYSGVKQEITEIVEFLKHPAPFAEIGARVPKGVLLVGPPGTGKTLIAKAVAGEAGVPFLSVTGSDFMEMFVGVGASRVRDLFDSARKMGKAIIFIDEIDSIGRKRGAGLGGGHDEREQTLNQMLAEMDGFEPTDGIVMMAATNRPDILDPALLRPGRFDRQVVVPLPELDDRKKILSVHLKGKRTSDDVDVDIIARGAPGMSGADLANLVNEAALFAVRRGRDQIDASDFDSARDRVILGIERLSVAQSPENLERTAYHEAGHALCAAVQDNHDPVHKVTIIPTGMALGVTMTLPTEDRHTLDKAEAESRMVMAMGGRVAESLVFDEFSSGAANDLAQATSIARLMVTEWGMSSAVGPMSLSDNGPVFLGAEMMQSKNYSPDTAKLVDTEVRRILTESEDRCREILTEYRKALDFVARALLEHETISGSEVERLIALAVSGPVVESNTKAETETSITEPIPAEVTVSDDS
ncbi:MAG: ATP-dependent zinc metalloprotease FtsH [Acidimicrobiaceae bacterium]|nr:ATP-dependent zinc metalloprotease FtsH [Acidimicrobiaceae bacterium]MXW62671.1 ATP-dependent zinc metalloprotease FtsH [Acidimicrobiaceae bacterium]MXW74801.1 ATP-dependent zinc metalloprotease FtsH [Acidimicrobiaceae bacterium]MYA73414.1 ATP-dependent zinc metalloprotease FtsH [Acidimicrobiaceae bacterium]MYC42006.1 ATP-dependent zinc metalloprotease FtsH [Acidimicrobiaceae bacterium]